MRKSLIISIISILFLTYTSIFIIPQTERGIVLRFGKVLRNSKNQPIICNPGLHFKIPFLETIKFLDARIQTLEIQTDRYLTNENKDLIVDSYLKWRVTNFSRYYAATGGGNLYQTQILLKRKFNDHLRSTFSHLNVKDIITNLRSRLTVDIRNSLNKRTETHEKIQKTSATITSVADLVTQDIDLISKAMKTNSMAALGIEVIDVRIKRIELPSEISKAIYANMREEREAIARQHRSEGQEKATKIRAVADKTVTEILAKAERIKLTYRGEGDAMAIKLFSDAFNQDPEFYVFIRSLHAYEKSFKSGNDVMVLSPDTDFFRFMQAPNNPLKTNKNT
ncbi:Modulator of FtsH protease HflC [Candidatus Hartigia pinicola]|nr:Modulator of FtsH protease HflC [Candidatus Hartigia pinicola]